MVVGGCINAQDATNRVEMYDISLNTWTELSVMPTKPIVSCSLLIVHDNQKASVLYAFGGIEKLNGEMNVLYNIHRLTIGQSRCSTSSGV